MAVNKIYTSDALRDLQKAQSTNPLGSYYKQNRVELLTEDVAKNLNTYRNWKQFDLALPPIWDDNGKLTDVKHPKGIGIKSLFSPVAAVYGEESKAIIRRGMNIPLLDTPENRKYIRDNTDCSIRNLVELSQAGKMGRAIYDYSDFMYCKHLGKIPNNYMITLRKFPMPCGDHINYNSVDVPAMNNHMPDMGRLITWIGTPDNDMSNILKYKYAIPWQELKAPIDEPVSAAGGKEGGGALGQMFSALDGSYAKQLRDTGGLGYDNNEFASKLLGGEYGGVPRGLTDQNRVIPSRQATITSVQAPGVGLGFTHDISITFDYELRSYDGINGRSAILDLIGNILMVTYLQGKFFKGSYRGSGMHTSNLFANLDIFKNPDAVKSPSNLINSLWKSAKETASGLGFTPGNYKQALKNLGNQLFEIMAQGAINKLGRPQQFSGTSMISPTPTGQWHLTIGNPLNPILSIGNLVLDSAELEHYGPLGIDDFPTGIKVKVTLKHAKPRDSVGIEQMYMQGDARIYTPMGKKVTDMYTNAKYYKAYDIDTPVEWNVDTAPNFIASQGTPATNIVEESNIYLKYFGTNDVRRITITGGEGFVGGADPEPESEDGKKK